jgi:hypothetical protein
MSNDINLVSGKAYELEKELKRLKALRITAVVALVSVALISVLLFLITLLLPISSVKKDQEKTISSIALLKDKLAKYSLINDRVKNIAEITKQRKNYSTITNTLIEKVPTDLSVDILTIEDGVISISVGGVSLIPINEYINTVIDIGEKKQGISGLVVESLVLNNNTGKYILTLQADIL